MAQTNQILRIYQLTNGYAYNSDSFFLVDFAKQWLKAKHTILDLGSGSGVVGLLCARHFGSAVSLLDINPLNAFLSNLNAQTTISKHRFFIKTFSLRMLLYLPYLLLKPYKMPNQRTPRKSHKIHKHCRIHSLQIHQIHLAHIHLTHFSHFINHTNLTSSSQIRHFIAQNPSNPKTTSSPNPKTQTQCHQRSGFRAQSDF